MDRVGSLPNIETTLTNNVLLNCSRASHTMGSGSLGRRGQGVAETYVEVLVVVSCITHSTLSVRLATMHSARDQSGKSKESTNGVAFSEHFLGHTDQHLLALLVLCVLRDEGAGF